MLPVLQKGSVLALTQQGSTTMHEPSDIVEMSRLFFTASASAHTGFIKKAHS